jgi:hypothetical protein
VALASSYLKTDSIAVSIFKCSCVIPCCLGIVSGCVTNFIMSQAGGDGDGGGLDFPASFTMKVNEWKFRVIFTY